MILNMTMENKAIIRPYQAQNKNACLNIIRSNTPLYFAQEEVPEFENWLINLEKGVLNSKNAESEFYFVLEHQTEVLGCGGYTVLSDSNEIYLTWGMVQRDYQKMGFGVQLLQYRLDSIKEKYPNHTICIATTQDIAPFFEKIGFVTTVVKPKFYSETLDRVEMELIYSANE